MAYFSWKDSYSVGIATFDEQHKRLISFIDELYQAMSQRRGDAAVVPILNNLVAYTKTHFAAEERAMEAFKYAGYPEHKQEHTALTLRVMDFVKQHQEGKAALSLEIGQFLKDWLTHHIVETDKQYGPYLASKGVK